MSYTQWLILSNCVQHSVENKRRIGLKTCFWTKFHIISDRAYVRTLSSPRGYLGQNIIHEGAVDMIMHTTTYQQGFLRVHPYNTSAIFWTFFHPPIHSPLVSINSTERQQKWPFQDPTHQILFADVIEVWSLSWHTVYLLFTPSAYLSKQPPVHLSLDFFLYFFA